MGADLATYVPVTVVRDIYRDVSFESKSTSETELVRKPASRTIVET